MLTSQLVRVCFNGYIFSVESVESCRVVAQIFTIIQISQHIGRAFIPFEHRQ